MTFTKQRTNYGNGRFGQWFTDQFDLPAYEYTCMQTRDPVAKTNTSGKDSIDHWHQVGNDRITLTAHNGGYVQFFIADRGMQWLSYRDATKDILGGGICFVEEGNKIWSDLYNSGASNYHRIFGTGYYRKITERNELQIDHWIYPPFGDDPVVLSEIRITNESTQTRTVTLFEFWGIKIQSLIGSLLAMLIIPKDRKKFGDTKVVDIILRAAKTLVRSIGFASDQTRERFSRKFKFESVFIKELQCLLLTPKYRGIIQVKKDARADRNYFLEPIFLASYIQGAPLKFYNTYQFRQRKPASYIFHKSFQTTTDSTPCTMLGHTVTVEPGETKSVKFIFGTAHDERIPELIKKYKEVVNDSYLTHNFQTWKKNLLEVHVEAEPWLTREAAWHSYYMRSAALFDSYYQNHYLPQGNAYTFLHGANGAIRDYSIFLVPMIYLNPNLAREMLEYIYRTMTPEGELPYALVGFGQNLGAIVHETSSDLHLFLLWSLLEYLYATRDFQFLEKHLPFYPLDCGQSATVLDRIEVSLKYLFQRVGVGEHGMIKVGSGDWSDGISLLVKNRGALLKRGESTFNSAFALYIIPLLRDLLKERKPKLSSFLIHQYELIKDACLGAWNGRWFYRGWNGKGGPIGNENLFLEHHPWLLLSDVLTSKQSQSVISHIHKILDERSQIGQLILYPPAKVLLNILPGGWDVNGGIWFAMNFLLTWAYSKHDPKKAYQCLLKNSMAHRAEVYPHIWYGIWSGPDSYNADYPGVPNPGQTFIHPATPQTDFPIMNLNLHACMVGSIIKLSGIRARLEGLDIDPKIFRQFWTPLVSFSLKETELTGHYKPIQADHCKFRIRKPKTWNEVTSLLINGNEFKESFTFEAEWITLGLEIPEGGISFVLKGG